MALDRKGIATAVKDLLIADTTTLYGTKKLLQLIEPNPVMFTKAKVSIDIPNALYLWVSGEEFIGLRSQNNDILYTIDLRFESMYVDPNDAVDNIDNANKQVTKLINTEVWGGQLMSSYYTDANAQIYDIAPVSNILPAPEVGEGKKIVIEIEGAINITTNSEV